MTPDRPSRQSTSHSSLHHTENATPSSTSGPSDLEKAETAAVTLDPGSAFETTSTSRVSRIHTLARKHTTFNHPLSHTKTAEDVIVDFDGPDDPYRPINWPVRKKIVTTALYGFTTMGATWSTSV